MTTKHRIAAVTITIIAFGVFAGYVIQRSLPSEENSARQAIGILGTAVSRNYLAAWVDTQFRANGSNPKRHRPRRAGPGEWELIAPFDWSIINVDPRSQEKQIRLICLDDETPVAVYFGDGARVGIIVSINGDFGVEDADLAFREDRFAVYAPGTRMRR